MAPSKFIAVLLALAAVSMTAAQAPPPPPPPATPPAPSSGNNGTSCDPLRLRVCGNLLRGLLPGGGGNGTTNGDQCCPLLGGLVGVDAAVCLCTALRANVLGIVNLNVPLGLRLLLSQCGRGGVSASFTCAPA
ncbi:unnamed protein product [Urochloa decumbens]|uniref:Bifunctional inhibitor/plant lipid transfer protein/seed storage helical domain-containing protein n=1 Tax=Urochloa decumbens TaxID=240449 RepID=A0ABC9H623_9POAL